jgi:hypothetical protein
LLLIKFLGSCTRRPEARRDAAGFRDALFISLEVIARVVFKSVAPPPAAATITETTTSS